MIGFTQRVLGSSGTWKGNLCTRTRRDEKGLRSRRQFRAKSLRPYQILPSLQGHLARLLDVLDRLMAEVGVVQLAVMPAGGHER